MTKQINLGGGNELAIKTRAWDLLQMLRAQERDVPTRAQMERLDDVWTDEELFGRDKDAWFARRLEKAMRKRK